MDTDVRELLGKTPLAEAVWLLWRQILPESFLDDFYQAHRGRCFERSLSFAHMVHLVSDALLRHGGRAQPTLADYHGSEQLPASQQAFYAKLRRMPVPLSEAFLAEPTRRLRSLLPERTLAAVPASLAAFRVLVCDGKTFKKAAKRLKLVRGRAGRALGGKALVGLELTTGLLIGMAAEPDGHVNEAKLVPRLLETVRTHLPGLRLWVADRQFGDPAQLRRLCAAGEHCVLRLHKKSRFVPDAEQPLRQGVDEQGRPWTEQIGTLSSTRAGSIRVRRITLTRPGQEPLVLITDLLDETAYPAADLLALYRQRWSIEQVFGQLTEVFHLCHLIGSSPQAIIFQGAFCMLLYNLLQVVRAIAADSQERAPATVSTARLFKDLHEQMTVLHYLSEPDALLEALHERAAPIPNLRAYLTGSLGAAWTDRWLKSPNKKRHLPKVKHKRGTAGHFSLHRVLTEHYKDV